MSWCEQGNSESDRDSYAKLHIVPSEAHPDSKFEGVHFTRETRIRARRKMFILTWRTAEMRVPGLLPHAP